MIPFYKAFSLVLRVFSRPLLAYTKRVHSSGEAQSLRVRVFFVRLGNFYHKLDSAINRRFLKVESQFAFKPLNDQLALEKGIEFFYEVLFYVIVIGFPTYEIWRASEEAAEKSREIDRRLQTLQEGTTEAIVSLEKTAMELWGVTLEGYKPKIKGESIDSKATIEQVTEGRAGALV